MNWKPIPHFFLLFAAIALYGGNGTKLFEENRTIPDGMGVNIHFFDTEDGLDALRSSGARWLRMDTKWHLAEKQKGVYDFSLTDKLMEQARARRIKLFLIIDYGNPLYEKERKIVTPEGRAAYAAYAAALAGRYKDCDVIWEIWNEPNNSGFWPGNDPKEYMAMLKEAVPAIRKADPDAVIVGLSTYKVPKKYIEACLADGLLDYVDALSFHPYQREVPEAVIGDVAILRELIAKHAANPAQKELPILCSEWGFSATQQTLEGQAIRIPRAALLSYMTGMRLFIYYDLWNDGSDPTNSEHNYGLFTQYPYLIEKPAATAYKTMTRVLNGFRFSRRIDVARNEQFFLLEFVDGTGAKRYAHWSGDDKEHAWELPAEIGSVCRISGMGQQLSGVFRTGDRLVSRPEVQYLVPTTPPAVGWQEKAAIIPSAKTTGPWEPLPAEKIVCAPGIQPEKRDFSGSVDYWFKPERDDFGKKLVVGGDLNKPFITFEIGLDKAGCPTARHWVWRNKKWLNALKSTDPVTPGQWNRITYEFGKNGRRLYVNGQLLASAPEEIADFNIALHLAPCKLKGEIGLLRLISGSGFLSQKQ